MNITHFAGIWKRKLLYEPSNVLADEIYQEMDVIWVQSNTGYFIDVRTVPKSKTFDLRRAKSFGGKITYDTTSEHLTWTRLIDFRPNSSLDVGKIKFLDNGDMQEDSVLEGDDFREIWTKLNSLASPDCAIELIFCNRQGYFIVCGDWFACSVSRRSGLTSYDNMCDYFDNSLTSELIENTERDICDYFSVVGRIEANDLENHSNFLITNSVNPDFICKNIASSVENVKIGVNSICNSYEDWISLLFSTSCTWRLLGGECDVVESLLLSKGLSLNREL